jgi:hypothetical protein
VRTIIDDPTTAALFCPGLGFLTCFGPAPPVGGRHRTVYSNCMTASGIRFHASVVTGSATSAENRR